LPEVVKMELFLTRLFLNGCVLHFVEHNSLSC